MQYKFFVKKRSCDNNKIMTYDLIHIKSGILFRIHIKYNKNENENMRLEHIREKLKTFINSDELTIFEHIKDENII